jgi:hypothetical protein
MKKTIITALLIFILTSAAFADIRFGGGASYNSESKDWAYSLMGEYLMTIVPGALKLGAGAQYYSPANYFELDLVNTAYFPAYLIARVSVPLVPVLSSFFLTGRYGYTFLARDGKILNDGGVYYAAGIGKSILYFAYIEAIYSVYHWNKLDKDYERFSVNIGFSI